VTTGEAAILGLIQGLTEFLPISSTAHLLFAQANFGMPKSDLHVEVATHLGTVGAVLLYYRREWALLARETITGGPGRRTAGLVALASAMLVLVLVVRKAFPAVKEWRFDVHFAAVGIACVGVFLLLTARARRRDAPEPGWTDAVAMGLAQCVSAIVPGWSRSGSTIGTALFRGCAPEWAAKFSFLMSVPAVLGGTLVELKDDPFPASGELPALGVAGAVAFVSGLLAIHALLRIVGRGRLSWFGPYCIAVGVAAWLLT
jgi:undecaprenyl-diphosphatase